mgnify:CR=1 FL=1
MKKTLTAKQEAFCQAYVETNNPILSYRAVYNVRPKHTDADVDWFADNVMAKPKITARIAELRKEQSTLVLTADDKALEDSAPGPTPFWELVCRFFKFRS